MAVQNAHPEFDALIEERTRHFSGREWVFEQIDRWLSDPAAARVFLLSGGPGTGKTAIAARLVQAGRGDVVLPGAEQLTPGFLTYAHFCQAGRDSTLSPMTFVRALSSALAGQSPAFRAALESQGSGNITITGRAEARGPVHDGATITGVSINQVNIEIHGDDPRAMFDEAVRQPLLVHAQTVHDPIVILVDSLDEALTFNPDRNIAQLLRLIDDFPPEARFLLTSRSNNERVFQLVGEPSLDLLLDAPPDRDEVRTYAEVRLARAPAARAIAALVAEKSRGNFLYAYHVVNDLLAREALDRPATAFELPDALDDVYRAFLKRELAANQERWSKVYRPLLGAIVVAGGDGLARAALAGVTRLAGGDIDDVLGACREYLAGGETPDRPYRIYHQSFREFLLEDPKYHVYPAERHRAIAEWLLQQHAKSWRKCEDEYAIRYTPHHLAEAARGADGDRDGLIRTLIETTGNQRYQERYGDLLGDVSLLHEHLLRAVGAASWSSRDEMLPWLVRAGRGVADFRNRFLTGASVIALARAGEVAGAERRLPLFAGLDRDWQAAASLIIAWLAMDRNRAGAVECVDRVAASAPPGEPLPLLIARVRAALAGDTACPFEAGAPQPPDVGRALVQRLSGQEFDRELLLSRGMNVLAGASVQTDVIEQRGYAAQLDGPVLVNSAREFGPEATAQVDAYVDAHAGYNYVEYRNRSLWVLLHAVLRHHPDQRWVRDRLERILTAALTGGGADFTAMAPLTAAALRQRERTKDARPAIAAFAAAVRQSVDALGKTRGANDSWSVHRRSLTALMEVAALVARDAPLTGQMWADITTLEASHILDGYAGFRAPAELRLADALRACRVGEPSALDDRLTAALRTAHHIQDYRFCARITARCSALRRWHSTPLDGATLTGVIDRFAAGPEAGEFAADHVVGERFEHRDRNADFALPVHIATQADTLEALADVFQRPSLEFLRLNPNVSLSARLAPGTPVRVPDPGFAPLLAVHFAARAAVDESLGLRRIASVRSLVPASAANPTALDSVLGYLLMTAEPEDAAVLDALIAALGPPRITETPAPPAGEMTIPA